MSNVIPFPAPAGPRNYADEFTRELTGDPQEALTIYVLVEHTNKKKQLLLAHDHLPSMTHLYENAVSLDPHRNLEIVSVILRTEDL